MDWKEESRIGLPDTLSRLGVPRASNVLTRAASGTVVGGAIGGYRLTETILECGRWPVLRARQSICMLIAVVVGTEIEDADVMMGVVSCYKSLRAKCKQGAAGLVGMEPIPIYTVKAARGAQISKSTNNC